MPSIRESASEYSGRPNFSANRAPYFQGATLWGRILLLTCALSKPNGLHFGPGGSGEALFLRVVGELARPPGIFGRFFGPRAPGVIEIFNVLRASPADRPTALSFSAQRIDSVAVTGTHAPPGPALGCPALPPAAELPAGAATGVLCLPPSLRGLASIVAGKLLGSQGAGIAGLGPPRGGAQLAPLACTTCGAEHTFTAVFQSAPGVPATFPPQSLVAILPEVAEPREIAIGGDELFLGRKYSLVAALTHDGRVFFAQGARRGERVFVEPLLWGVATPQGALSPCGDPFSDIARGGALLWYESAWKGQQATSLWQQNGQRFL